MQDSAVCASRVRIGDYRLDDAYLVSRIPHPVIIGNLESCISYPASCIFLPTMSYRNLEVWKLARAMSVDIHKMSLTQLPKFEMYEEGSQIRRASKSIRSNIVEGYGRRRYKQEFIKFLVYAHSSCDETLDHLDTILKPVRWPMKSFSAILRHGWSCLAGKSANSLTRSKSGIVVKSRIAQMELSRILYPASCIL